MHVYEVTARVGVAYVVRARNASEAVESLRARGALASGLTSVERVKEKK